MPAEQRDIRGNLIRPYGVVDLKELGIPTESSDADAEPGRLYFHIGDNSIKYKDDAGNVYSGKQGDVSNPMTAPLDAGGNDINNVGALEADTATIGEMAATLTMTSDQTGVTSGSTIEVDYDTVTFEESTIVEADATNSAITIKANGKYWMNARTSWLANPGNWATGDTAEIQLDIDGLKRADPDGRKAGDGLQGTGVSGLFKIDSAPVDITAVVFQNSGVDQTLNGSVESTRLEVARLG